MYNASDTTSIEALAHQVERTGKGDPAVEFLDKTVRSEGERNYPALWLHSLRRAAELAADKRNDVRNGAIRTIMTLFSTKYEQMGPFTWQVCMELIWLRMLYEDYQAYLTILELTTPEASEEESIEVIKGRIDTSGILLGGISTIIAENMDAMQKSSRFTSTWQSLIDCFKAYISIGLPDLAAEVFFALSRILRKQSSGTQITPAQLQLVTSLWTSHFPRNRIPSSSASTQKAFEKYIGLFTDLSRLDPPLAGPENIQQVADHFYNCIVQSECSAYSTDVDSLTSLQDQILKCIGSVQMDGAIVPSTVIRLLARFAALPTGARAAPGKLSFVALSKAAMGFLPSLVEKHVVIDGLFDAEALLSVLRSLGKPIKAKYAWQAQGKSPKLWQKATTTSVVVLGYLVPKLSEAGLDQDENQDYWHAIVQIIEDIQQASPSDLSSAGNSSFLEDEDFDVEALEKVVGIVTPALGAATITDTERRFHACALLRNSLVHELEEDEIPDLVSEPLGGLYKLRFGRTYKPELSLRTKMAYCCLNELFRLVSVTDGSTERVKLAQAAAPYLILRAAIPLKAYIVDQPLRGRMPQPQSERKELLLMLRKMRELESEPRAIPAAAGVSSKHKKHLLRLYPLIIKAAGVAHRDVEMLTELQSCLEVLSDEFGF